MTDQFPRVRKERRLEFERDLIRSDTKIDQNRVLRMAIDALADRADMEAALTDAKTEIERTEAHYKQQMNALTGEVHDLRTKLAAKDGEHKQLLHDHLVARTQLAAAEKRIKELESVIKSINR